MREGRDSLVMATHCESPSFTYRPLQHTVFESKPNLWIQWSCEVCYVIIHKAQTHVTVTNDATPTWAQQLNIKTQLQGCHTWISAFSHAHTPHLQLLTHRNYYSYIHIYCSSNLQLQGYGTTSLPRATAAQTTTYWLCFMVCFSKKERIWNWWRVCRSTQLNANISMPTYHLMVECLAQPVQWQSTRTSVQARGSNVMKINQNGTNMRSHWL